MIGGGGDGHTVRRSNAVVWSVPGAPSLPRWRGGLRSLLWPTLSAYDPTDGGTQRGLDDTLRFAEHEGTDHPVACMLLRSTSEADAVNGFLTLEREAHTLPELLVERHASSTMLNHYVLVHDALVRPASFRRCKGPVVRRRQPIGRSRRGLGAHVWRVRV